MVRTRIAPSPTGYPHIGTIYQALFDWAYAHGHEGSFLVRIEDTDRNRLIEDAEEKIFSALDWFSLTEDESVRMGGEAGPYRQSERIEIYKDHAKNLIEKDGAYYCTCTKDRLETVRLQQQKEKKPVMYDEYCRERQETVEKQIEDGTDYVIRLKVPENGDFTVQDEIRGEVTFKLSLIEDSVLLKSDGYPTYHFAVVVDDHLMKITHAVRGEEWLPSMPKHILIYDYFGWEKPLFFHTPVLRNPDKSKLSKRHGHTNVQWYIDEGFLPEALLNFLALMGWSHPEEKEIFTREEFVRLFDLKDLKPVAPIFDINKLTWMNGMYIRELSDHDFKKKLLAYDQDLKDFDGELLDQLIPLAKTRMKTLKDFRQLVLPFYKKPKLELETDQVSNKQKLKEKLEALEQWELDDIIETIKTFNIENDVNFKYHYRVILGQDQGLPLGDVFVLLGKEQTLKLLS